MPEKKPSTANQNNPSVCVHDTSAVLAVLYREVGEEAVLGYLDGALLSSVNYAETIAVLVNDGLPPDVAKEAVGALGYEVVDFDGGQGFVCGALRPITKPKGLSLGDRCCLALAKVRNCPVVTGDRDWADIDHGVEVILFR